MYGCSSTCSATTVFKTAPKPSITGPASFCAGGSAVLSANANYASYLWSTGATTKSITVTTAGVYVLTVTNGQGCSASAQATVTMNPNPQPVITGAKSFCPGSSTTLNAGSGYSSYVWSTGATTQSIVVNTAGTFNVTVTNSYGCSGSAQVTTTIKAAPKPTITGVTAFCSGGSTTLSANANYASYLWSSGATTKTITVTKAGIVTLTVTNGQGCTGTATVGVVVYAKPTCLISGNLTPAPGQTTTLCAPTGLASYQWNTGATSRCITVNKAGNYRVTVTNSNACTKSCMVSVTYPVRMDDAVSGDVMSDAGISLNAFPNPFASSTTVEFMKEGSGGRATVECFNLAGEKVLQLFEGEIEQDMVYKININSDGMADGVYVCRLVCGDVIINKRLILIR